MINNKVSTNQGLRVKVENRKKNNKDNIYTREWSSTENKLNLIRSQCDRSKHKSPRKYLGTLETL